MHAAACAFLFTWKENGTFIKDEGAKDLCCSVPELCPLIYMKLYDRLDTMHGV